MLPITFKVIGKSIMTESIERELFGDDSCEANQLDDITVSSQMLEKQQRPIYSFLTNVLETLQLSAKANLRRAKEKAAALAT